LYSVSSDTTATVLLAPGIAVSMADITVFGIEFRILGSLYWSLIAGFAPADLRAGLVSRVEAGGRLASPLTLLFMSRLTVLLIPALEVEPALQVAGPSVVVGGIGSIGCVLVASGRSSWRH
jgi:hypothetical protein